MFKIEKLGSGSYRMGPDLYARICEGGFELWRASEWRKGDDSCSGYLARQWKIGAVVESSKEAVEWLKAWGKEIYRDGQIKS